MKTLYPQNERGRQLAALIENINVKLHYLEPNSSSYRNYVKKLHRLRDVRDHYNCPMELEQFMNDHLHEYVVGEIERC